MSSSFIDFEVLHFNDEYEGGSGWRIAYKDYDCVIGYSNKHLIFDTEIEANDAIIRMVGVGYRSAEDVESMTDEVLAQIVEGKDFYGDDIPMGSLVITHRGEYGHTLADGKVHISGSLPKYAQIILRKLGCLAITNDDAVDALNETEVVIKVKSEEKEKFRL